MSLQASLWALSPCRCSVLQTVTALISMYPWSSLGPVQPPLPTAQPRHSQGSKLGNHRAHLVCFRIAGFVALGGLKFSVSIITLSSYFVCLVGLFQAGGQTGPCDSIWARSRHPSDSVPFSTESNSILFSFPFLTLAPLAAVCPGSVLLPYPAGGHMEVGSGAPQTCRGPSTWGEGGGGGVSPGAGGCAWRTLGSPREPQCRHPGDNSYPPHLS